MRELENTPKKPYPSPEEALKALNDDCLREENERREVELKAFLKTQMQSSFEVKRLHEKFLREKVVKNENQQAVMPSPSTQKTFPSTNKEKIASTPAKKTAYKRPLNGVAESVSAYHKQYGQHALSISNNAYQQQLSQYADPTSFPLPSSSPQQHNSRDAAASQITQGYQFMLNNPAAMAAFYHQQQFQLSQQQHLTNAGFQPSQLAPYLQVQKSSESLPSAYPSVVGKQVPQQHNHWHGNMQPVKSEAFLSASTATPLLQAFPQQQFQLDHLQQQQQHKSGARWEAVANGGYPLAYYHLNTPMAHHQQHGFSAQQMYPAHTPCSSSTLQLFASGAHHTENPGRNNSSNDVNSASPSSSVSNSANEKVNEQSNNVTAAPVTSNCSHNQWTTTNNVSAACNPYAYTQVAHESNSEEIGNELNLYLGDGNFLDFPDTMSCNALCTPYPAFDQLQ